MHSIVLYISIKRCSHIVAQKSRRIRRDIDTCNQYHCNKEPELVCEGCSLVKYCSRKCQKRDWSRGGHRLLCQGFRESIVSLTLKQMDSK